jgi:hypothetical protein
LHFVSAAHDQSGTNVQEEQEQLEKNQIEEGTEHFLGENGINGLNNLRNIFPPPPRHLLPPGSSTCKEFSPNLPQNAALFSVESSQREHWIAASSLSKMQSLPEMPR